MSKFAKKSVKKSQMRTFNSDEIKQTLNNEGGIAYTLTAKKRLASRVLTSFINEKKFYGDNTTELLNDLRTVAKTDPLFVLKLAAYSRNVMNMRSSSVFTLAHASLIEECKQYIKEWTPKILTRADEPAEAISIINQFFDDQGKKPSIPSSLKKGISLALRKFDAYQLMKYKGSGNSVNMYDVFNVCHPIPASEEQNQLWKKFIAGELTPPKTWEVEISTKGSTKENWENIIPSMGYMALMRNLRNFVEKEISEEVLTIVCNKLSDPKEIAKSKQLPFRFFSAFREISNLGGHDIKKLNKIKKALDTALDISVQYVEPLDGVTAIFTDHSGSMQSPLSSNSSVSMKEIATVLHAIFNKVNSDNVGLIFASDVAQVNGYGLSTLKFVEEMNKVHIGASTETHKCFTYLTNKKIRVDRIVVLSDMQCYDRSGWNDDISKCWDNYRNKINPNAFLHSVDLNGYGTSMTPLNQKNVALYAGFTERFMELIKMVEKGTSSMIKDIEMYE